MKNAPPAKPFGKTEQLKLAGQRFLTHSSLGGFRAVGSACESPTIPVSLAKSGCGAKRPGFSSASFTALY
ncbi:hypothetical protein JCM7447_16750 [Corynebacterium amycolatum]